MNKSRYSFFPVHLWIYNHPFPRISDQVEFFLLSIRQAGYPATVGPQPRMDALNVVIENFSQPTRDMLIDFCESTGKKVAVIMTEHIDFLGSQIHFYRRKLFDDNSHDLRHTQYMAHATQRGRVRNLLECLQYIHCFFTLGDLPELRNFKDMVPGVPVRSIPFPKLPEDTCLQNPGDSSASVDVVFTGYDTPYRSKLLKAISAECTLLRPAKFVSRKMRNQFNRRGKIVLNIPQFQDWPWISSLRVFSALICGKATISLGTVDTSRMCACCRQLDVSVADWMAQLRRYVNNSHAEYERAILQYSQMAEQYGREKPFPYEIFESWGMCAQANKQQDLRPVRKFYRPVRVLLSPQLLEEGYLGFNLVSFSGKIFAVRQSLGPIDFNTINFDSLKSSKSCFIGESVDSLKKMICSNQQVMTRKK